MKPPTISVVMAVYNAAPYLADAIESVLGQTFGDFEFILVDDASTDHSAEIIESYRDKRIKLVRNPVNGGPAIAANMGLDHVTGEYIARMDSDDISLPTRFETQVRIMEENRDIGVLGSWARTFGGLSDDVWRYPVSHEEIQANLIFNPKLHHSSVIMRKSVIDEHQIRYDSTFTRALDYELWVRHADKWRYGNTDDILLLYRQHEGQISSAHYESQQRFAGRVRRRELARLGIVPDEEQMALHQSLSMKRYGDDLAFLEKTRKWLELLAAANASKLYYDPVYFEKVLATKWVDALYAVTAKNHALAGEIWSTVCFASRLYEKADLPENAVQIDRLHSFAKDRSNPSIAIYGTGRAALHLYRKVARMYPVVAFIDRNPDMQGKDLFGKPVLSLDRFTDLQEHRGCLILCSILGDHDREVIEQIRGQTAHLGMGVISWKTLCP